MRIAFTFALVTLALALSGPTAGARERGPTPWCIQPSLFGGGMMDCTYHTLAQCRASVSGRGGSCIPNPAIEWARREQQWQQEQRRRGQR